MKDEPDEQICIVRGGGKPCRASGWSAEHNADDLEKIVKSHLPGERQETSSSLLGDTQPFRLETRLLPVAFGRIRTASRPSQPNKTE